MAESPLKDQKISLSDPIDMISNALNLLNHDNVPPGWAAMVLAQLATASVLMEIAELIKEKPNG